MRFKSMRPGLVENELDTDVDTKAHDGHRNENVTPLTLPITEEERTPWLPTVVLTV